MQQVAFTAAHDVSKVAMSPGYVSVESLNERVAQSRKGKNSGTKASLTVVEHTTNVFATQPSKPGAGLHCQDLARLLAVKTSTRFGMRSPSLS